MRTVNASVLAALAQRQLIARDFIWITARNFGTGLYESVGFWSDIGAVSALVMAAATLTPVARDYTGSGTMIQIDDVPLTSDLTVRTIGASLNGINTAVNNYVRGYDLKGAPVEIHRGLFDPVNRNLVGVAELRFVGFVDEVVFVTPPEGGSGSINVKIVSHTRELTRASGEKRSDESQQRRAAGDRFYKDTGTVGEWEIFWGQASGKVPSGGPISSVVARGRWPAQ